MEQEQIEYWIKLSEYDLEVAQAILEKGYYLHCGFMCHQSIEKVLKAYYVFSNETSPPRTHNLDRLIRDCFDKDELSEEQYDFIDELTPMNIQARYPAYKEMLYKLIDMEKAREILNNTEAMHAWIKEKMHWKSS